MKLVLFQTAPNGEVAPGLMTDRGVVAVLDPRLVTARYGDFLRASLPPFWTTTDPALVRAALRRLAAASSAASSAGAAAPA